MDEGYYKDRRINLKIIEKIKRYVDRYYMVHKANSLCVVNEALSEEYYDDQIETLLKFADGDYQNKMLLEIGSGFGMFIALTRQKYGLYSYGVEPDLEIHRISLEILENFGFKDPVVTLSGGENLPFPDEKFDFVYSANVLEHTKSPERVFFEALRVLKRGGILQFVVPNYSSFFEGHYGIFWIPNLPKKLAKIYVKLWGRDPSYMDTLYFITYKKLIRILEKNRERFKILDLGEEAFKKRLREVNYPKWKDKGRLGKVLKLLIKLRACEVFGEIACKLKVYTPIVITGKKL